MNEKNRVRLEISEPVVIASGENTGWGSYQFPYICYTKSGNIYARWAMRPDTIDPTTARITAVRCRRIWEGLGVIRPMPTLLCLQPT